MGINDFWETNLFHKNLIRKSIPGLVRFSDHIWSTRDLNISEVRPLTLQNRQLLFAQEGAWTSCPYGACWWWARCAQHWQQWGCWQPFPLRREGKPCCVPARKPCIHSSAWLLSNMLLGVQVVYLTSVEACEYSSSVPQYLGSFYVVPFPRLQGGSRNNFSYSLIYIKLP